MKKLFLFIAGVIIILASVHVLKLCINRGGDVFNANLEALTDNESSKTCYYQTASGGSVQYVIICNTGVWGNHYPYKCMGPDYAYVSSATSTCVY